MNLLFVCVHNAGRSQMAQAFANHLGKGKGVRAFSAGTHARTELNPVVVQAMEEAGISMEGMTPKVLTQAMADDADRTISMGCGVDSEACPARFLVTEDWELDDPAGQPVERVREIRDEIRARVAALMDEISGP